MRTPSFIRWVQSTTSSLPALTLLLASYTSHLILLIVLLCCVNVTGASVIVILGISLLLLGTLSLSLVCLMQNLSLLQGVRHIVPQPPPQALTTVTSGEGTAAILPLVQLFEQSPIGMAWTNLDGRYVAVNHAFCDLLGYTAAELQQRRWQQLTHPEDLAADLQMMALMQSQEVHAFSLEKRVFRKDGGIQWVYLHVTQILSATGDPEYHGAIIQDIGDRKRVESSLKEQAQCERLIAEVTQRIRESFDSMEIIQIAVNEARQILATDRVAIYQFADAQGGTVIVESVADDWPSMVGQYIQDLYWDTPECLEAYRMGQIQNVPDILHGGLSTAYVKRLRHYEVRANLIIPILQGSHLWGLLVAQHCQGPRPWSQHHVNWLQQIANQLAIALQNATLYNKMGHQLKREKATNAVLKAIGRSFDLDTVFSTTVAAILPLLQVEQVSIMQYVAAERLWRNLAEHHTHDTSVPVLGTEISDAGNDITASLKRMQVVQISDAVAYCQGTLNQPYADCFPGAWLMVPIIIDSQVWGVLTAIKLNRCEMWKESEVEIASMMADQLAIAIHQSQLYCQVQQTNKKLQRLAIIDGLTQIANRRYFNDYLNQEWLRMVRMQQPLSLIMGDVDYFKPYNDTYGHQAGDVCLQRIAVALQQVVKRPGDLIARYGGEEFAIILPETNLIRAVQVADGIRQAIEKLAVPHPNCPPSPYITMSLGVTSQIPSTDFSVDMLIQLADQALYLAKSSGRNCYRVVSSPSKCLER